MIFGVSQIIIVNVRLLRLPRRLRSFSDQHSRREQNLPSNFSFTEMMMRMTLMSMMNMMTMMELNMMMIGMGW